MRIVVIERGLDIQLRAAFEETAALLRKADAHEIGSAHALTTALEADVYLLCSSNAAEVRKELADAAGFVALRLNRTILVGPRFDFPYGWPKPDPGTLAESIEVHRLGGWISADALTSWDQRIGLFAGPQELMAAMQTNALKAFQSENYAVWFGSRLGSLAEFLKVYFPILDAWADEERA